MVNNKCIRARELQCAWMKICKELFAALRLIAYFLSLFTFVRVLLASAAFNAESSTRDGKVEFWRCCLLQFSALSSFYPPYETIIRALERLMNAR